MSDATLGRRFKRWFWRPPRPHGETIAGRTVSFLELFYDLVYVVVISQAAHHLTEHVTRRGVADFAVVYGLIWTAWVNGSLYLELHGREDGRTRTIVFIEMGVLVLLAVFTADAAGQGGRGFALVYALFLAISTWLWNSVRRQDRRGHPEFLAVTVNSPKRSTSDSRGRQTEVQADLGAPHQHDARDPGDDARSPTRRVVGRTRANALASITTAPAPMAAGHSARSSPNAHSSTPTAS